MNRFVTLSILFSTMACTKMDRVGWTPHAETIKIGLLAPFSGSSGYEGRGLSFATRLAAQEINDAGGIGGKKIEIIAADDRCSADYSPTRLQSLIDQGAVAVVGGVCSSATIAALNQVAIPKSIVMISGESTSPTLSSMDTNGLFYRTCPSDAFQGNVLANQIWKQSITTVDVIYINDAYGKGLADAFKAQFQSLGGTVPNFVSYDASKEQGFQTEVTQLFAGDGASPGGVVIVGYPTDSANITRDIRTFINPSSSVKYFGVDGNVGGNFVVNADSSIVEGMQGTQPQPPISLDRYQSYLAKYKSLVGEDPTAYSVFSYDAVYLLALAMSKGGGTTTDIIKSNIVSVSKGAAGGATAVFPGSFADALKLLSSSTDINFEGASGSVDLGTNGDPSSGSYAWWKVVNGTVVNQESVNYP